MFMLKFLKPHASWLSKQQGTSDLSFVMSFHIIHGLPPASIGSLPIPSSYLSLLLLLLSLNPLSASLSYLLLPHSTAAAAKQWLLYPNQSEH